MSNKSDNGVAAWKVASLLINDETLVLNWELFHNHLGLHPMQLVENRTGFSSKTVTPFTLLYGILEIWVADNGKKATIGALGEVLINIRRIASYEELFRTFSNHDAVITITERRNVGSNKLLTRSGWEPCQEEIKQYEKPEIRAKTAPGSVSILELMPRRQAGRGQILITISYLLNMLSKIGNNPVAVVSINGRQRSGKSFLATQMVKYLKGKGAKGWQDRVMTAKFTFIDNECRVTSGIQVWHEPLKVEHEGKTIYVILLDTQGLHDQNTGTHENAVIFGLSVLLSSVFVYNEPNLAEDSLDYLHSFLEFTRFAVGGEHNTGGNILEDIHLVRQLAFQKLVLLLRDWRGGRHYKFGYYDDNNCPHGQVESLKNAKFDTTTDMHPNAVERREGIKRSFENISVYAMSGPGNRYPDMPEYTHSSNWDSEFRSGITDFAEKLLSPSSIANSTKKVFGDEVTGAELKQYVSRWAEIIQGMDGVIQSSIAREEFLEFHSQTMEKLESRLVSGRVYGGYDILARYTAKLREKILGIKDQVFQTNLANMQAESERRKLREQEVIDTERRVAQIQMLLKTWKLETFRREERLLLQIKAERQEAKHTQLSLRRQAQVAWNATMRQAEGRLNDAKRDLALAQTRWKYVIDSRASYTKQDVIKTTNRILGIYSKKFHRIEIVPDPAAYQAALNLAEEEVRLKEQRVAEAEQNFQMIRTLTPTTRQAEASHDDTENVVLAESSLEDVINRQLSYTRHEAERVHGECPWRKHFQEHLIDLVRLTKSSKPFLDVLVDNGILQAKDIDSMTAKSTPNQQLRVIRNARDVKVAEEDEFSSRVDNVIKRCESWEICYRNLVLLARKLKVSGLVLARVKTQIDRANYINVVHEILDDWIMGSNPQPNLAELIAALRDLGLNLIADKLLQEFSAME